MLPLAYVVEQLRQRRVLRVGEAIRQRATGLCSEVLRLAGETEAVDQ
jgi:hypothetical protein